MMFWCTARSRYRACCFLVRVLVACVTTATIAGPAAQAGTSGRSTSSEIRTASPLIGADLVCHDAHFLAVVGASRTSRELMVFKWDQRINLPLVAKLDNYAKRGIRCRGYHVDLLIEEHHSNHAFSLLSFEVGGDLQQMPVEATTISTEKPISAPFEGEFLHVIGRRTFRCGNTVGGDTISCVYRHTFVREEGSGLLHYETLKLVQSRGDKTLQVIPILSSEWLEAAD